MRRLSQILGWTMVWAGLFTIGVVSYQLYFTGFLNDQVQADAEEDLVYTMELRRRELAEPLVVVAAQAAAVGNVVEPIEFYPEQVDAEGTPFAVMRIPKIDLSQVVFEGVTPSTLKDGPGHMPWTPVPGQPGNSVISGHRTTHGAPFYDLDLLEVGDEIEVDTVIGPHVYTVRSVEIVLPTDVWVTESRDGAWLTLTTCHPKLSARERLIIFAELTSGPNLTYVEFQTANSTTPDSLSE